ncbi:hypothetical protein TNCV_3000291 [Trichonephila clavipes]|nr:hypothetical protein TNCV_3000291 [Trichonephila clavipes]
MSTMRNLTYTEKAYMHYLYSRANGNGRTALRMYRVLFPDRRRPDHRIFSGYIVLLHRQLRYIVTRHDADRRRNVHSPSPEERILYLVADRPESSTRADAHHVIMGHQTIEC